MDKNNVLSNNGMKFYTLKKKVIVIPQKIVAIDDGGHSISLTKEELEKRFVFPKVNFNG